MGTVLEREGNLQLEAVIEPTVRFLKVIHLLAIKSLVNAVEVERTNVG